MGRRESRVKLEVRRPAYKCKTNFSVGEVRLFVLSFYWIACINGACFPIGRTGFFICFGMELALYINQSL